MAFDLSDYVDVPTRIQQFREQYPDGSLQSHVVHLPDAFATDFVAVKAYAYRTPDDPRPGVGLAWERVPGKTPYTRDSELMNAETSAWGRALVAVLAADTKRGVASANEVRRGETATQRRPPPDGEAVSPDDIEAAWVAIAELVNQKDTIPGWKYAALQRNMQNLCKSMETVGLWKHGSLEASFRKAGVERGLRSSSDVLVPLAQRLFDAAEKAAAEASD